MATPTTNAAPRSFDRASFYTIDTPTGPATSRCAGPRSPKDRLEPLLDLLDLKAVPAGDFRLPCPGRSSTPTPYRSAVRP